MSRMIIGQAQDLLKQVLPNGIGSACPITTLLLHGAKGSPRCNMHSWKKEQYSKHLEGLYYTNLDPSTLPQWDLPLTCWMPPYHYALSSKAPVAKFKSQVPLDATGTIAHVQRGDASGECLEAVKSVDRSTGKCLCFALCHHAILCCTWAQHVLNLVY